MYSFHSEDIENGEFAYSTSQLTRLLSKNMQWSKIKDTERERMGLTLDHEGEFWYVFYNTCVHIYDFI